jgi:hypothetical protein
LAYNVPLDDGTLTLNLKTEGILRKFQKSDAQLTQKWKDLKNNGTT